MIDLRLDLFMITGLIITDLGIIVKLSLFKPDAFPAWSDDFSKSPLCGTVSSAQSGSSVFIGCELPQCVEIENIMLKSQNTPTCQYFSDLL